MYQSIYPGSIIDAGTTLLETHENGNVGFRLLLADPNNYGYIGMYAVDLSIQNQASNTTGATGNISFSTGLNTTASGDYSNSFGLGTIALNHSSTAVGSYNIGVLNTVLEIGIGTTNTNRKNALEIYKDGSIIAPNIIINNPKSLVTKEYLDTINTPKEYNFDAVQNQTSFIVTKVITFCSVFVNGIKQRYFTLTNNGINTTVLMENPLNENDWVQILEY